MLILQYGMIQMWNYLKFKEFKCKVYFTGFEQITYFVSYQRIIGKKFCKSNDNTCSLKPNIIQRFFSFDFYFNLIMYVLFMFMYFKLEINLNIIIYFYTKKRYLRFILEKRRNTFIFFYTLISNYLFYTFFNM